MVNTLHTGVDPTRTFINYGDLGHPEVMGFPSGHPDNHWLRGREYGEPREYIRAQIRERGRRGEPMPVMFHVDTVWIDLEDKGLDIVRLVVDAGRAAGFELATHAECHRRRSLWTA